MYKNQLQELAQRSCFNLPSYACIREGPDHAPRFKASVNFNGEIFESPTYCTTLRQAEHTAAEVALNVLSSRGPSRSLTARVLDETGIYKNLLQETAHRAGLKLPVYTTVRSGPGHVPIFTCTVELAGMNFTGEPAKTKKQAEKNAAIAAWSALKRIPEMGSLTNKEAFSCRPEEQDQVVVARVLSNFRPNRDQMQSQARKRMGRGHGDLSFGHSSMANSSLVHPKWRFLDLFTDTQKHSSSFVSLVPPPPPPTASKILPLPPNRAIGMEMKERLDHKAMEEHFRDEEEWLGLKSNVIKKVPIEKESPRGTNSSIYRPFSISDRTRVIGSPSQNPSPIAPPPRMFSGGFNFSNNPHGKIAPAVQIRSVIPVCAAPIRPPSPRTPNPLNPASSSTSKLKEISTSALMASTTHTGEAATEVTISTLSSNKPQLKSHSQLSSSEFNSKLQL